MRWNPYGKALVYLDNGASAQKPRQVVERMVEASYYEYANVHRGLHYLANAATDNYEAARGERALLPQRLETIDEVVFTKSATEAINLVASSYGRSDHIEGRRRDRADDPRAPRQTSSPGTSLREQQGRPC